MMKTKIRNNSMRVFLFSLFIVHCSLLISCVNPIIEKIVEPKKVSFESNGGSSIESQTVFKNQTVKRPPNPSRSGYIFAAWYRDNETFLEEWDFAIIPTADMTLYAKWIAEEPGMTEIPAVAVTVTGPVKGAVPDTTAAGTGSFAEHFTVGAVSWIPYDNPFKGETVYTATVALIADGYYTFAGNVAGTINGNNAAVVNNTGTTLELSYTFPATNPKEITKIEVVTQPAKLDYIHTETLNLAGLVVTLTYEDDSTEDIAFDGFAGKNMETVPAHGQMLSRSEHDGRPVVIKHGSLAEATDNVSVSPKVMTFTDVSIPAPTYTGSPLEPELTVKDGAITLMLNTDYTVEYANNINAGTGSVTITGRGNYAGSSGSATFTINRAPITTAAVNVTGPAKGQGPDATATATGTVNFTVGTVTWTQSDDPSWDQFNEKFKGEKVYTASVTLTTATANYTFTGIVTATIYGQPAVISNNTGTTATLSYTFAATDPREVNSITINDQPATLTYTHGDKLSLTGLVVTLSYDDNTTETVAAADFAGKNIGANPAHDQSLIRENNGVSVHNGKPVVISYGNVTASTNNVTVNQKSISSVTVESIPDRTYNGSPHEPVVTLRDGTTILTLNTDYTVGYSNNTYAGTTTEIPTVNITGIGNYTGSASAAFTINKAEPTVLSTSWPGITTTYESGRTLSAIPLTSYTNGGGTPGSFTWTTPADLVGDAGTRTHNMTFTPTDNRNYSSPTRDVDIEVAKANGATVAAPTADTIGVTSVTLNAVTAPANGQFVQYGFSTANDVVTAAWQDDLTFNDLYAGTLYYFFARSKESLNYKTGAASGGTAITTTQQVDITLYLDVEELLYKGPNFDIGNNILTLSGTQTAFVNVTNSYYSIYWEISGVGAKADQRVTGTSSPITLDAANTTYNSPGFHAVTVRLKRTADGIEYKNSFRFKIE